MFESESPPYLHIAGEIQERIRSGRLQPGQKAPSIRAIARDWGVATATAAKVVAALRQRGLVETRQGVGTIVRDAPPPAVPRPPSRPRGRAPGRTQVVVAALGIADAEGVSALSMRRLAAELNVGVMSLYRVVGDKDDLLLAMVRAAFGSMPLPDPAPLQWRTALELVSRIQWNLYRRHLWLPGTISFTRPLLAPEAMAHTEWTLQVLAEAGLDTGEAVREAITLPAFVRSVALALVAETEAESETGITGSEWWLAAQDEVHQLARFGRFPRLAAIVGQPPQRLDELFEHGLARHLDGLHARLSEQA